MRATSMTRFGRILAMGLLASIFAACSTMQSPKNPPVQEVVTLTITSYYNSIWFDNNSAVISDDYDSVLQLNADYLNSNPTAMVQVQGNSSEIGTKEINEKLASKRAKAVVAKLIALGVNKAQIQEVSFGASKPTFPNDKKGHAPKNRRADIIYISGAPSSYYIDQVPVVATEDETVDFEPISIKEQKQATRTKTNSSSGAANVPLNAQPAPATGSLPKPPVMQNNPSSSPANGPDDILNGTDSSSGNASAPVTMNALSPE